jgi:hypothetical protein
MKKESCSGEYYANRAADGLDQHEGYWPPLPTLRPIETTVRKLRTLEEIIASNPDNIDEEEEGYETPQQMGWVDSQGRP